jgi:hypothetical protein
MSRLTAVGLLGKSKAAIGASATRPLRGLTRFKCGLQTNGGGAWMTGAACSRTCQKGRDVCNDDFPPIEHAFRKVAREIGIQSIPLAEELILTMANFLIFPTGVLLMKTSASERESIR